jgi:D-glycero-alpha-D-manno-heptose-7-phosphate kinase
MIQQAFDVAIKHGAISGKVSGAGGGGFIIFIVEPPMKLSVINALNKPEGRVINFQFSEGGTHGWKINNNNSELLTWRRLHCRNFKMSNNTTC